MKYKKMMSPHYRSSSGAEQLSFTAMLRFLAGITLIASALIVMPGRLFADTTETLRFTAAKDRDLVTLTIKAGDQSVTVQSPVNKGTTATTKRDDLKTRARIAANLKGYNWTFDNNGTDGFDLTVPGDKLTATFKPGKSGEAKDVIKKAAAAAPAPGGTTVATVSTISFASTVFDAFDSDGLVSEFCAGVSVSDVEYVATVAADDPELGGDLSGSNISQVLFNRLLSIAPADQVSLQYQSGSNLILAQFANSDSGVIIGNTSSTDGVEADISQTPVAVVTSDHLIALFDLPHGIPLSPGDILFPAPAVRFKLD